MYYVPSFNPPMYYGPSYPLMMNPEIINPTIDPINQFYNINGPVISRYGGGSVVEKAKKGQTTKRKKKIKIKDLILIMYLMKHVKTK